MLMKGMLGQSSVQVCVGGSPGRSPSASERDNLCGCVCVNIFVSSLLYIVSWYFPPFFNG